MTSISVNDVQYLAQLSNLQLTDKEVTNLQIDLEHILSYVEQLSELNTDGVEPTYQVTDLQNVWRQDEIDDYGLGRDELLALSADSDNQQIKVPKVL